MIEEHTPTMEDEPYSTMTCWNHQELRWRRKNPKYMEGQISMNMQLMFAGTSDPDTRAWPFGLPQYDPKQGLEQMQELGEYIQHLLSQGYVFECSCAYSDLYYIADGA